ncbi:conserved hypothetical protein [Nocardioides sp. AX2bis]|nr:conserved hypothetical protein [Nocardioides sp. AX2bis]
MAGPPYAHGVRAFPTLQRSGRSTTLDRPAADVWAAVASARPDADGHVWYVDAPGFVVRGAIDRVALGRGRRWPLPDRDLLRSGDRAGFWEVLEVDHDNRRMTMQASVRAPGTVRMEVSVADAGADWSVATLAISFAPRGVLGWTYLLTDLPAREVVMELTQSALLADVAAATGARVRTAG